MKVRPQFVFRFLDEKQYTAVKVCANSDGVSVNKWLLRLVEAGIENGPGLAPDTAKGTGIQRTHAVSPKKAKVDAPEKPAPLESKDSVAEKGKALMEWDGPEPEPPPPVKKPKPEMPSGLSNTQMQRWIREHR